MEITTIKGFLSYYKKTREATKRLITVIPKDQMGFAYLPGKFTIADQIRHIAAIERTVFAEIAIGKKPCYKGCGAELADGYDEVISYFDRTHDESIAIFSSLSDEDLKKTVSTMNGSETDLGSFLRALFVHEIHHCATLYIYLNLLGVKTPPVFGLTEEQVKQFSI